MVQPQHCRCACDSVLLGGWHPAKDALIPPYRIGVWNWRCTVNQLNMPRRQPLKWQKKAWLISRPQVNTIVNTISLQKDNWLRVNRYGIWKTCISLWKHPCLPNMKLISLAEKAVEVSLNFVKSKTMAILLDRISMEEVPISSVGYLWKDCWEFMYQVSRHFWFPSKPV